MSKTAQAIILGVMCLLLTVGICLQVRTVNSNGNTTGSNQQLNSLKSQVLKMKEKYEQSYQKLEKVQDKLEVTRKSVAKNNEELNSLEQQIKQNNIWLGITEVKGQGVEITVTDATVTNNIMTFLDPYDVIVHDVDILELVNELRNAGAEAIEVNGQRITGNTAISCDGNVIVINGEKVSSPFTISAIGYPERMATLDRPGGYLKLELEEKSSIKTTFEKKNKIKIPKYIGTTSFKYAKTIK